ncbi:hypothetical protein BMF94_4345 [Rhodotorula taiwanensis]|uniref:Alpha/beta hydrolase fold-3 domain-containing protein n=1 Tax=Rhodotorula taiwanensis TaxID=741276 RepID=A0A2S5B6X1_9BASI|nr:hypothetical protein BMF94_4345 [Rhodotorula taiwanensis]
MSPSATDPVSELHPKARPKTKLIVGIVTTREAIPAAISHIIRGPPEPTWTLGLSITTKVGRAMIDTAGRRFSKHPPATRDDLIRQIRRVRFIDPLSAIEPDKTRGGTVWSRDLIVSKRALGGVLKEAAEAETGKRVLRAEWTVAEWLLDPEGPPPRPQVILHLHGGAHVVQDVRTYRTYNAQVSMMTRCRVFCIDYRLAPEAVFPGSLLDALTAYFYLTEDLKVPPSDIVLSGDSAGGGIAIELLMYLRDNHLPQVGSAMLLSPWLDLTTSFGSWVENRERDFLTIDASTEPLHPPRLYVSPDWPPRIDRFREKVVDPYISPALAPLDALRSLPPLLIHTGGCERLRDEQIVFVRRARLADPSNKITHQLFSDGVHVFASVQATRSGAAAQKQVGAWLERVCSDRPPSADPDGHWAREIDEAVTNARKARLARGGKIKPFPKASTSWRYERSVERWPDIRVKKDSPFEEAVRAAAEANAVEGPVGLTEVFRPVRPTKSERRQMKKEREEMRDESAEFKGSPAP